MEHEEFQRLFEAVAEALILADPGEPASLAEIAAATRSLADRALETDRPWAIRAEELARDAAGIGEAEDPLGALEALGARLGGVHDSATSAEASPPAGTPASAGPPAEAEATSEREAFPLAGDEELLRDFVARAGEHLEAADESMLALERDPSDAEALNALFRAFHTIKGMAGFLALSEVEQLAHDTEGLLDAPRKGSEPLDRSAFDAVFAAADAMRGLVAHVLAPATVGGNAAASPEGGRTRRSVARTAVRVDEERLDRLLDTIGELVIAEAMMSEAARHDGGADGVARQLARVDKITRELQEMATSLRMVPLRSTFTRMARLVRETARKAGKQVEFVTVGEDTELDKLVVDRIADPLIHILRNAVDHGIETPKERAAEGKAPAGRIELRAYHAGGGIHVEVADDGRGFDGEALVGAARRSGLLAEGELPDAGALDLAFAPGLSTARVVTDVSGRGVGMDVVRRTVESLRGQVDVRTEPGKGSTVSIRLPLTLAIIDGIVVRVGEERYIIPTLAIERSVRPMREQLTSVIGRGDVLQIDGRLVPLVHLRELFGVADAEADPAEGIVVIVGQNGGRAGLVACEILGQQQIVIKSLGDSVQHTQGIAGGAIMPDGKVGLIVDVGGLVRLARHEGGVRE